MRYMILSIAAILVSAATSAAYALDNCAAETIACPYTVVIVGNPPTIIIECRNDVDGVLPQASMLNPSKGTVVMPRGCNWQYINGVRQADPCSTTHSTNSTKCAEK